MNTRLKLAALVVLCAAMPGIPGCQCMMQCMKGFESQTTGINRTTSVYDYNGHLLGRWSSKTVIDADSGGLTTFFDSTGTNRVLVNGGILVSVEHR